MTLPSTAGYSRYVRLMKVILPVGILLSVGFSIAWPYLQSLGKETFALIDFSRPEIRENRMLRPHYLSTDKKGQPYHVDADWAKKRTEELSDLVNPTGAMTMIEGQTFDLKAQKGIYNSQDKVLNLEGDVTLISTDGYHVKTEKAHVTLDNKVIEGDDYIEGEGPTGAIMGQEGFKVESRQTGKIITLKGPSRVVINQSAVKKKKEPHDQ
jgi:lipopolysaccharide export system protein LptC